MTTTHLFVELLVIGFGSLIWLGLLAAAAFGFDPVAELQHLDSVAIILPLLSLAYVLGILTDRVADLLTDPIDQWQQQRIFDRVEREQRDESERQSERDAQTSSPQALTQEALQTDSKGGPPARTCLPQDPKKRYFESRRLMALYGRALWDHLEYGRSRLRICRGWALNGILLMIALEVYLASAELLGQTEDKARIFVHGSTAFLIALCFSAWWRLNKKEYEKIERQAPWLEKHLKKGLP